MASDMTNDAGGKFEVDENAVVEIALNPSAAYGIQNIAGDVLYYSTNGDTPELSTATKVGHGIVEAVAVVLGQPTVISGVTTLKLLNDTAQTSKVVVTRRGFAPAWSR